VKPNIDISVNNESAFCCACMNGHLEVVQWLLSVKPDINISAQDEFAFCITCYLGRLEVAKWLQSLKPYLYVIEYDENGKYTGYKIRSKEEANWEKRKYALHMTLKEDINILYHLPVDIAKAVTLFV
jgi:ankyrin repeat protein